MQSKVSERGQTVIPREIRKAFQMNAKTRLEWVIRDGTIVVYPLPTDPVRGSFGILKGLRGVSTSALLAERKAEKKTGLDASDPGRLPIARNPSQLLAEGKQCSRVLRRSFFLFRP